MQATASTSRLPSSQEPTTSSLLLSTLTAYSDLAKQLFSSIENPSSTQKTLSISDTSANKTWTIRSTSDTLSALHEVDTLLSSRISLAHQHALNQARIEALQTRAKKKDRETRTAILELSQINSELAEISRLSAEEVQSMDRAERQPVGHLTLLSYAQRLARYTSAPPGYKLPSISAVKEEGAKEGEGEVKLGADYNQYAKRAAAYYDPAIPSMPQEMPFPSDAMMRQGILNSQAMLEGQAAAEQPVGEGEGMEEDEGEETDFGASYAHLREQQRRQDENEEDAFDLDLN